MSIRNRKLVYGVGINDADYFVKLKTGEVCPIYEVWKKVLQRGFDVKYKEKNKSYKDVSVCEEWLRFSNFRGWVLTQDYKNKRIDKDLLCFNNKIYSPNTCCFLPQEINSFMTASDKSRGELPLGVSYNKNSKCFKANINNPFTGKYQGLGSFLCPTTAHEAWRKQKESFAIRYAEMLDNPLIAEKLRERYSFDFWYKHNSLHL